MIAHQITNSYGNYNYNAYIYSNASWQSHFHGNYELIYVMDGKTKLTVYEKKITLLKGELLLIPPYSIHSLTIDSCSKTWIGVFSEDYIPAFCEKYRNTGYSPFRCEEKTESILKDLLFFQGQPEHFMLCACLYMVCSECIKNSEAYPINKDNKFIALVTDYIAENISEDLSLKATAAALNYEYHYFSSLFNKCFFMNFKSFINLYRFEKACRLLSDKTLSISDISGICGFGSIRNFNRIFKKLGGITPGEYRNSL